MIQVHHLNFGLLGPLAGDPNPASLCHCLLLEDANGYALVDTGFGTGEMANPTARFGAEAVAFWGIQGDPSLTAAHQLGQRGIAPADVRHIIMTHLDVDHAGGLADFPNAYVHLASEELANLQDGNKRYAAPQFAHGPQWQPYSDNDGEWLGLPARKLALGFTEDVLLIPLFGHTRGHCGVAIPQDGKWLLHAGDVYYRRTEVTQESDPLDALVARFADDDSLRRESLARVKELARSHAEDVTVFSTHDTLEYTPEM